MKARLSFPLAQVSYRAMRVWQRNLDTFLRLWTTESWPPFIEPVMYIVAMGFGLGAYVTQIEGLSFLQFIAPAFVATAAMFVASFECTFGSFVRMEYQKTFDAIISTPLNIEEVIAGEILWGATRAVFAAIGVLVIIAFFGLIRSPWALAALPVALLEGLMFASLAMLFTAIAPAIDAFNYYITLGITPMFLFSGVFFPLNQLPQPVQALAWLSPLTHAVSLQRALALGELSWSLAGDLLWIAVLALIALNGSLALMRRRLIK